jgi:hypothetical protein
MDKKGPAYYLRLPISLEADIERLAVKEARSKCDMMTLLLDFAVYVKKYHLGHFITEETWGEGNKG